MKYLPLLLLLTACDISPAIDPDALVEGREACDQRGGVRHFVIQKWWMHTAQLSVEVRCNNNGRYSYTWEPSQ